MTPLDGAVVGALDVDVLLALVDVVGQTVPTPTSTLDDPVRDGDMAEALARPYTSLLGPVAPVMLGLFVGGVSYIWSGGRLALPATLSVLLGGYLLPFLPGPARAGGYLLILFGVAGALWSAWNGGGRRPR